MLGDLVRIKHGYAFKGEYFGSAGTHVILTPGNFNETGGFKERPEKAKWYSGPVPEEYVLGKNDLIVAMTEQGEGLLGSSALVPRSGIYLHNQRLGLVTPAERAEIDRAFLYYLFNSRSVRQQIRASANGAKIRHTSPTRIYEVKVGVPDQRTQRRIASILSAYDDLIENNTQRIAILEEMARRIYEEWFVRFRFPGHEGVRMVESEFGLVPEGWEHGSLGRLIDFEKGKKPHETFATWAQARVPALLIDALRGGAVEFADAEGLVLAARSDTIMVMDGSGSGQVFVGHEGAIGSTLGRYRVTRDAPVGAYWLFLHFLSNQSDISNKNIGAAIPHANKDYIRSMPLVVPTRDVASAFESVVTPMFSLVERLKAKNGNLRATRDLLLPKLISGELDVSEIPEQEAVPA